jgi:hypothetical protein
MRKTKRNGCDAIRSVTSTTLLASGCSNLSKPGPAERGGMSPDATVSMREITAFGAEGGKGSVNFQGHSYPSRLVGGVTGGVSAAKTQADGEVYNLHNISDFKGLYTQSSGRSGASELWTAQRGRGGPASARV